MKLTAYFILAIIVGIAIGTYAVGALQAAYDLGCEQCLCP